MTGESLFDSRQQQSFIFVSNQLDAQILSNVFITLYMFRARRAHHQERRARNM